MRRVLYMKGECMMLDEKESIAKLKDYATRILKLCEDYERTGKINRKLFENADPKVSYRKEEVLVMLELLFRDLLRLKFLSRNEEKGRWLMERYIDDLSEYIPYISVEYLQKYMEEKISDVYRIVVSRFSEKHKIPISTNCNIRYDDFGKLRAEELMKKIEVM